MPTAGYCRSCGTNVWLGADGACVRGHPSTDVLTTFDVRPRPPGTTGALGGAPTAASPAGPALRPKAPEKAKHPWVLWLVAGLGLLVLVANLAAPMVTPWVTRHGLVSPQWRERVARDYPGWELMGSASESWYGPMGETTSRAFTLRPPGRDFSLQVLYDETEAASASCTEHVLREGSQWHTRAESLLAYLERHYASRGKSIEVVCTEANGSVSVGWVADSWFTVFRGGLRSVDVIHFDPLTGAWLPGSDPLWQQPSWSA